MATPPAATDSPPADPPADPPAALPADAGEGRILRTDAEQARTAAARSLAEAAAHLKAAANPLGLARAYPLGATAVAAAAGAAAVTLLVPSRKSQAARRLRTLERVARLEARAAARAGQGATPKQRSISGLVFRLAKPALLRMAMTALSTAGGKAAGDAVNEEARQPAAPADDSADDSTATSDERAAPAEEPAGTAPPPRQPADATS